MLAEGAEGGFAAVYGVLKAMEEAGTVRRGYFVAGLGAAQFALPGAMDRLRGERTVRGQDPEDHRATLPLVLAATDPASPSAPPCPGHRVRGVRPAPPAPTWCSSTARPPSTSSEVGAACSRSPPPAGRTRGVDGLVALVKEGRQRRLVIGRIDGVPVADSTVTGALHAAGFVDGYRGLVLQ